MYLGVFSHAGSDCTNTGISQSFLCTNICIYTSKRFDTENLNSLYGVLAMPVLKRPSIQSPGRARSSDDFSGLQDALKPWCKKGINFFTYTSERKIKSKDVGKLKLYLPHLQRVQSVHRTWSFSLKSIDAPLRALNQDLVFYKDEFSQENFLRKYY